MTQGLVIKPKEQKQQKKAIKLHTIREEENESLESHWGLQGQILSVKRNSVFKDVPMTLPKIEIDPSKSV